MGLFSKQVKDVKPVPVGRPPKIKDYNEDDLEVGPPEDDEELEEIPERPIKSTSKKVGKPKTLVVRELPMEAIRSVTNEKTGEKYNLLTIEEALAKIINYIEEE